jgi:antitoxin HicB
MAEQGAYKLPLVFEPQPEGGYTLTYPVLPELITEGNTIAKVLAIIEAHQNLGRALPPVLRHVQFDLHTPFWIGTAVAA